MSWYSGGQTGLTSRTIAPILRGCGWSRRDDWDRYEAGNWHGLVRWLEENPAHPERGTVIEHLHRVQDEYLAYGREYMGWAMYVLVPQGDL